MIIPYRVFVFILFVGLPIVASSQTWNPQPGWKDSYAVDGVCYCDSNGYDHGLDTKTADTPIGVQNVVDICETIELVMGQGAVDGRIPYNDIQCGNGPANDAADEAGCPGRVDIGSEGCDQIGPTWDLETAYADAPDPGELLDSNGWIITASHNNNETNNMIDGLATTRWDTGTVQANGQWIVIDLLASQSFNKIILNTNGSPDDYPRLYSVFVSSNGVDWGAALASGSGLSSLTSIEFSNQTKRYIRIEQNGVSNNNWWSIHELAIYFEQDAEPPVDPPVNLPIDPTTGEPTNYLGGIIPLLLESDLENDD